MAKLDAKALGLALGIVWGATVLLIGLLFTFFTLGFSFINLFSKIYIGYKGTLLGSLIGGLWGFVDAGIGGVIIAWLYNKFSK